MRYDIYIYICVCVCVIRRLKVKDVMSTRTLLFLGEKSCPLQNIRLRNPPVGPSGGRAV